MKKLFTMLAVVALFAACCGNSAKKANNACTDGVENCAAATETCGQKEACAAEAACCKDAACKEGCTCKESENKAACTCKESECKDTCCKEAAVEKAAAEVVAE